MTQLHLVDWIVVGVYFLAVLLVGLYASGRQETTHDYFVGDRTLPWWAVTLSIVATETSAVTYIGLPGLAYRADWSFLQFVLGLLIGRVLLAAFFIRAYYRFDILTVYGFLERRFGNGTRVLAALFFVAGRVVASGVRLFAACLAVQVVTGLPLTWAIAGVGALGIAYTFVGGLRAVVWTDCILGATFMLGGVVAAAIIIGELPNGLTDVFGHDSFSEKFAIFHAGAGEAASWKEFLASERPFVIGLFGGIVMTLATHGTDQDMVQRMLACSDSRGGSKSVFASGIVILPLMTLFLAIGSLLWVLHSTRPEMMPQLPPGSTPTTNPEDYYFPMFLAQHLPRGVAGFLFAGIFAAALSSLTSVLNALASTTIADFYRPLLRPMESERHYLRASRIATVLWGLALIGVAGAFRGSGESVIYLAMKALTYFYGALLGVFVLGIFTRRGSGATAVIGMCISVPCVILLQLRSFLASPEEAPTWIREALAQLPPRITQDIEAWVPLLAWQLWVPVGALIAFAIAVLGRETIARRG